jgi:type II secretory pathway component PulF
VRWRAHQKAIVFRGLAILINAGVHLVEGLDSLARQAESPASEQVLRRMAGRLSTGQPLHRAMQAEGVFAPLEVGLVKVGESSGSLHSVLNRLADMGERSDGLRRKLISAMIYPAFVLSLCTLLLVFAPVLVFSDLLGLLRELKTELPLATRLYLGFSDMVLSPLFYGLGALALGLGGLALRAAWRNRASRMQLEQLLLGLPGLGPVLRSSLAAEISGAISTCFASGVPILRALSLSREVSWSVLLDSRLERAGRDMQNGRSLTEALSSSGVFSPLTLIILTGGEEVGMISESLDMIERQCRQATEDALESMQKLVEPFLLLFVGLVVGFIAIATLAPTLKVVEGL